MTQAAMDNDTMVAVTQADRDAAADYAMNEHRWSRDVVDGIEAGRADSESIVQAFARHRHQSGRTGAGEALDRPALLAAARFWWARNMTSHFRSADITGDGRVNVYWSDTDESGKYTLPVDYAALSQSSAGEDGA